MQHQLATDSAKFECLILSCIKAAMHCEACCTDQENLSALWVFERWGHNSILIEGIVTNLGYSNGNIANNYSKNNGCIILTRFWLRVKLDRYSMLIIVYSSYNCYY